MGPCCCFLGQSFSSWRGGPSICFRSHQISKRMMVIMWFSGLRGAIAYALSLHLEFKEETRKVLVTTTLVVVLFTTIILGGGTMPLMKFLESRKRSSTRRARGRGGRRKK